MNIDLISGSIFSLLTPRKMRNSLSLEQKKHVRLQISEVLCGPYVVLTCLLRLIAFSRYQVVLACDFREFMKPSIIFSVDLSDFCASDLVEKKMNKLTISVGQITVTMARELSKGHWSLWNKALALRIISASLCFFVCFVHVWVLLPGIWHLNQRLLLWYVNRMYESKCLSLGILKGQFTIHKDGKAQ